MTMELGCKGRAETVVTPEKTAKTAGSGALDVFAIGARCLRPRLLASRLRAEIARLRRIARRGYNLSTCGNGCIKRGLASRQRRVVRDDVRAHLARLLRNAR